MDVSTGNFPTFIWSVYLCGQGLAVLCSIIQRTFVHKTKKNTGQRNINKGTCQPKFIDVRLGPLPRARSDEDFQTL